MRNITTTCVCDRSSLASNLNHWLRREYKLLAISKDSCLNVKVFTVEDLIDSVDQGVCVFLYSDNLMKTIRIRLKIDNQPVIDNYLKYFYSYHTHVRKSVSN